MSDNNGRGGGTGELAVPLSILGLIFGSGLLYVLAWLGGTLGVALTGAGWRPPSFSIRGLFHLIGSGPGGTWPGHGTAAVVGTLILVLAALGGAGWTAWRLRGHFGHRSGLASLRDVKALTPAAVAARARQLRPDLANATEVTPEDSGVLLGNLDAYRGPELRSTWEDVSLDIMAPRAMKTTARAVPAILAAPGACMVTSNKFDVFTATKLARQRKGSTVWAIDAQKILHQRRGCWVDLLKMASSIEGARRLAGHFALGGGSDKNFDDFWMKAARNLLTALFHSAACSGGTLNDVLRWLATPADRSSTDALKAYGKEALAAQLQATIQGSTETRDGIYQTAREALSCLVDPEIAAWVLPDPSLPEFRPVDFVRSKDTLYLLSQSGSGGAAPIVAAVADMVMRAGVVVAERSGGRLPVPLIVVLDEAANICRIADLPELYSHLGSRGIIPMTILQSYRQGVLVWGEAGMDALWSAATVKVLGAGLDDADFAEKVSQLVGTHLVVDRSVSHSSGGGSTNVSRRRERVMEVSEIRAMPKGTGLLLATGVKVAMVRLRPWFQEPWADQIAADIQAEQGELTRRAAAEVLS